jgi:imidazolonepropionase-like amidohydrolase
LALHCAAAGGTIVIRNGSVWDSARQAFLPNRTVRIEGDHISAIVSGGAVPRGAKVIDARGKYVIPGLIDAHVHVVHVLDFAQTTGDEVMPLYLAYGVTALRDTGDFIAAEKLVSRYVESHPELCPRLFLCSPLIDGDPPFHRDVGFALTDPQKVEEFVGGMKGWGVSTLKIYVGTGRTVGRAVIEAGHRAGLSVTGHLGKYSAQDAVADGIDCLEHIVSVFNYSFPPATVEEQRTLSAEEARRKLLERRAHLDLNNATARALLASLREHKTMVDPTLIVYRNMILLNDLPEVNADPSNGIIPERLTKWWTAYRIRSALPAETQELRKQEFALYQKLTGMLYREGIPLLAGTDAPEPFVPPGASLHKELELMVGSGMPPAAVLTSATLGNARALHAADRLGSIEEGKLADLVILDANPIQDIRNTRKIFSVIRGGIICDPKTLLKASPKH